MSKWRTLSRNERTITVDGRHYFASRCTYGLRIPSSAKWQIWEMNQADPNGSKDIEQVARGLTTREVSNYFRGSK